MTTKPDWIQEIEAEGAAFEQRQVIDAINVYHVAQQDESRARSSKDAAGKLIRQYLELNDEQEIEDAERGLKALLGTRRLGKGNYDVRSIPWQTVKKLWAAGCLQMDIDMLNQKANAFLRLDCEPQFVPAGETTYLRIVKE